jgi:uncharacterized RDD family membrane protein YckC
MTMMDPVRWLVASGELDRVLELSADDRARYLAALRERDATLAADVESLLDEHRLLDAEGFLREAPVNVPTVTTGASSPSTAQPSGELAGASLGPYRIVRTLGRGGMGVVYEADEIDSGRRVALKVLKERLNDPRERERFHREGRLAASLNHPHCVFVFAASEVDGRLAIAMELMQGTLADRLKAHGPLPVSDAVDVTLQLLSGLQAASALGILHRDIKPSNCFIDADGIVKIGDFGISRSLRPTEDTALSTGTKFAATPAYASPEQLRGAALDTRSDVYSLGATLYELLTGRRPFEREDLMALLMAVANDAPQPPHLVSPAVPRGLSQTVLRCLAKRPEQRFADYDALAGALEAYTSTAASPATFGRRFAAGVLDHAALAVLNMPLAFWLTGLIPTDRSTFGRQMCLWAGLLLMYFAICETAWRASPGKAIVGLTLVDRNGCPPRPWQTMTRALIYTTVWNITNLLWVGFGPSDSRLLIDALSQPSNTLPMGALQYALLAGLFSSARRRNGYAGWHDLVTGTRVVERRAVVRAHRRSPRNDATSISQTGGRALGPFRVIDESVPGMPDGWRAGIDDRLRRPVWIREVRAGTPPLDTARLAIGRATRLRWIAGRRQPTENWDAFESVRGIPLTDVLQQPRTWAEARWWLRDLARECAAQSPADRPPLRFERVWVLDEGGAKLVDDPAMDGAPAATSERPSCAPFLLATIRGARGTVPSPWPLGAYQFIEALQREPAPSNATIADTLTSLVGQRAVLSRAWRALPIALVAVPSALLATFLTVFLAVLAGQLSQIPHEVWEAHEGLTQLRREEEGKTVLPPDKREALEVALATRYRHVLIEPPRETLQFVFFGVVHKEVVQRVLRRSPTEAEQRRASEHPAVRALATAKSPADERPPLSGFAAVAMVGFLTTVALCAVLSALAFRGGLMRLLGMEIVIADGRPASRLRVLARTALAWSPLVPIVVVGLSRGALGVRIASPSELLIACAVTLLVLLAGALIVVARPARGLQDLLAGTWVVPR